MAAPVEEDSDPFADDFYALLNISRDASTEEVGNAYRKLSKVYHPDKHAEQTKKKYADLMFFKIKRAYEVLSDQHRRVIYDMYGAKGLETEGFELIARTKSPSEIIAEYEQLQREREERQLQMCTNPSGEFSLHVDATDLFESYRNADNEQHVHLPNIEISKMSLHQSIEAPLTTKDAATLTGQLVSDNGIGYGSFVMSWKRLISHRGWLEFQTSVGNGLSLGIHGFRQIHNSCYCTLSANLTSTKSGSFKPQLKSVLACQLSKHVKGQMSYNILQPSYMTTSVIYDTEQHHALFSVQLGIQDSFLMLGYTRKFLEAKLRVTGKLTMFGGQIKVGVEKKITKFSNLGAALQVGVPNGVTVHLKLVRGNQTFLCPVHLSENIVPSAVFYGLVAPLITYQVIKHLIVIPFLKQKQESDVEKKRERFSQLLQQKIAEAAAAVELMKETVARSVELEESRSGLIILKATYGKLSACHGELMVDSQCLDVTIPLQSHVKDSKLILPETPSKSSLTGFYDPCFGEDKHLYIRYRFHNRLHQLTLADTEAVRLPQQKHLVSTEKSSES